MKVRFSKITLWVTAFGFGVALLEVAMSLAYDPNMNPTAKRLISETGTALLPLCPFAFAEHELPNVHILADRIWIYFDILALNTLCYFVLGVVCSFWVNTARRVYENRPR